MYFALNMTWTQPTLWIQVLRKLGAICSFWTCQMYLSWQAQDAANLMVSDFAKASRNLQFLDIARCIFRGRRRTRPTLWFQILRKLRAICNFWTCQVHFSWQAQDAANLMVSDFAKALRNLQLLDLRDAFCVAGAGRGQPYDHFSWQALYESTNRKVGNA